MRILITLCLTLCSVPGARSQCSAPRYQVGVVLADSPSELIANISIPLRDFSPGRLVCLASSLRDLYRSRDSIIVSIFSSHKAASRSVGMLLGETTGADVQMLQTLHARYVFSRGRHEEYVELLPALALESHMSHGPFDTRIDLPTAAAPHCHVEIANRCLIASEDTAHRFDVLRPRASGRMTLAGTITRSGRIKGIRVVNADFHSGADGSQLASAAVQNLSSWRMESGPRQDSIRITYSYVLDTSLPVIHPIQIRWISPNEVQIRGRPPS